MPRARKNGAVQNHPRYDGLPEGAVARPRGIEDTSIVLRQDMHPTAATIEGHVAIYEGEQRIIAAQPYTFARVKLRSQLADQNGTRRHILTAESLHAAILRIGVPPVAARTLTLFVRHPDIPQTTPPIRL